MHTFPEKSQRNQCYKKEGIILCNAVLCTLKPKQINQLTCPAFNNQAQTFVHDEQRGDGHKMFLIDAKDYYALKFSLYSLFLATYTNHEGRKKNQMQKREILV